jgi:hypothetical protein
MADNLPAGYDWLPLNGGENSDSNNNHKRENPRLHMAVPALTHCAQWQQLLVVRLSAPGSWRSGRHADPAESVERERRAAAPKERRLPASIRPAP